ncbi:MAG TPA: phosphotransferase [Hyphomicrobiaceae bacterium]
MSYIPVGAWMELEHTPRAADAKHLTEALRRSGVLGKGQVRDAVVESSRTTLLSRIIRLRLSYEGATNAPSTLILKTGLPGRASDMLHSGHREVEFYTQVAAATSAGVVPRCFEAFCDQDTKDWHLILEDLTDSHVIGTTWPLPPTTEQCESIISALARLHAEWWDDPRLGVSVGTWVDTETANQGIGRLADRYGVFAERLGDRLPAERRDLYRRFIDTAPRLLARYHSHRNLSIVHGDAHVWNFFLPRDGGSDVRLFDWDAWRVGLAANDLAYMMATHWYPERRQRMENRLLDHYHAGLLAHGVLGYDRRALQDDYRLAVLWQITTPIWQAAIDLPPVIWWSHLERVMLAVDDLGCRDLLV